LSAQVEARLDVSALAPREYVFVVRNGKDGPPRYARFIKR
jgi:hypothetical protein